MHRDILAQISHVGHGYHQSGTGVTTNWSEFGARSLPNLLRMSSHSLCTWYDHSTHVFWICTTSPVGALLQPLCGADRIGVLYLLQLQSA